MKLILCPNCSDVRKLHEQLTTCRCGRSFGRYLNDSLAEVGGLAIPIGLSNLALRKRLIHHAVGTTEGRLEAWIYDMDAPDSHIVRAASSNDRR